jgi:hypothetical protein
LSLSLLVAGGCVAENGLEAGECLQRGFVEVLGHVPTKGGGQVAGGSDNGVGGGDSRVGDVFVLVEDSAGYSLGPGAFDPQVPASIMFGGGAKAVRLYAVFGKGSPPTGFFVDECLHADR